MFVAAIVVFVPVVGALAFGCRLPEVGRLAWTLWFEGFVVAPVEGVVALDVVLCDGLVALDARVPVTRLFDPDVWLCEADV